MSNIRERPIDRDVLAEFKSYNQKGLNLLGLQSATESGDIVKAIDEFVDNWQNKRRGFLAKLGLRFGDPIETALALGIVWGNQIVRRFNWSWVCLVTADDKRYAVVSPDRSLVIYATYFIKECLDYSTADCTVLLAFNMQIANKLAHEAPYEYASVMRSVRRVVPKR